MPALAAIQGDFVDLRFVKGRKVCQIIIEAPIEAGGAIVSAFGTPNPSITIPVVLARLNSPVEAKATPQVEAAKPTIERKGGKLSREAAMLCQTGAFRKFLSAHAIGIANDSDEAAKLLRMECGVESRADIDHDEHAAARFKEIKARYEAWMAVA